MLLQLLCFFWILVHGTAGKPSDQPAATSNSSVTTPTTASTATSRPTDIANTTSTNATNTTIPSTTGISSTPPNTTTKPPTIITTINTTSSSSSTPASVVSVSGGPTSKHPAGSTTAPAGTAATDQGCSQEKAVKFLACLVAFLILGILVYAWMQYRKRKHNNRNERLDPDPFSVDNTFTPPMPMSEPVVIDQVPDDLIEFATARAKQSQSNPAAVIPHIEN